MANVEPPVAIYRSATTIGAVTIETLAFERSELLVAFAHLPPETDALIAFMAADLSGTG